MDKVDTNILFPRMMQGTNLLLLDYDVMRFHTFDMFRHLMMNFEMFKQCDPEIRNLARYTYSGDQIQYYMRHNSNINPFDNFEDYHGEIGVSEYEKKLKECSKDDTFMTTPTDVGRRFGIVFDRNGINGYALRYTWDTYEPNLDNVKVYRSDSIIGLNMAFAIIKKHNINTVMLSSVDFAVIIAQRLLSSGDTRPMTFIIGNYYYNYRKTAGAVMLKHIEMLTMFEQVYKYEFGLFDPFSGLNAAMNETNGEENVNI